MAVTQNTYTGNGSTVLYSFTFPYLETTDIKVSVNGTVVTTYTFANATTIQFNTAPANGAAIRIYRQTDDSALPATFYSGSAIRSADLNDNFTQNLYVTQESTNNAATATTTANTALSNSSTALSQSNTAIADSATAVSDSATALSTANTALSTANTALSTATTADTNATAALNAVAGTVQYVLVADVAAIPSTPGNGDAIEIADSTGIESFTPLTNLPAGYVGDPGLSVRLQYLSAGSSWNWLNYFANNAETRYLKLAGGSITGNLEIGAAGSLTFEGSTANTFETTLAVVDPTADRTITLPNVTGTVVTTGDSGTVTSTMIADGTIVNADVNASAAIAGTKISPDFGSQNVTTTGTATAAALIPSGSTVPTNGVYLPSANNVAISSNSSERIRIGANGEIGIGGANYGTSGQVLTSAGSGAAPTWTTPSAGNTDKIEEGNTSAEVIDTGSDGRFVVTTEGSERLRVDSSGRVGIGTTSVSSRLHVLNPSGGTSTTEVSTIERDNSGYFIKLYRNAGSGNVGGLIGADSAGTYFTGGHSTSNQLYIDAGNSVMQFYTGGSERGRWDSSGRFLVGTSSARGNFSGIDTPKFQIEGNSFNASTISVVAAQSTGGGNIELGSTGGTTIGNTGTVTTNGYLGSIHFLGGNGTNLLKAAAIDCQVDGTVSGGGANDMPGRLVFATTADGASSPTERMRINKDGDISFNTTAVNPAVSNVAGVGIEGSNRAGTIGCSRDGFAALCVNRKTNDGELVQFYQEGTQEGSISVSGTTVSYNGAHLSRWSQLPGGAERIEILRGTVLSNIDEMCGWGEEDNEQLNRMKVSDVEGDPNVAGVFQAWDDDDDTYTDDFYCAMTGDFIIRIAEGVTVQRGDLLMSADDGTAKPQDDDIVRSKTVAKVTSTHVTCTYEDGSYCVPCVLMTC